MGIHDRMVAGEAWRESRANRDRRWRRSAWDRRLAEELDPVLAPAPGDTVDRQRRTISFLVAAVRPSTVSSNMGKTSRMRRMVVAP